MGKIIESEGGEHLVDPRSSKWSHNLFWKIWKSNWSVFELPLILDCTLAVLVTKLKHDKAAYWFLWSRGLLSLFSV